MSHQAKTKAVYLISGAGVLSTESSTMFKTEKGKKQIEALKKIDEKRKELLKKQANKVNLTTAP